VSPSEEFGFWGGSRVERLHPRLVAEMLLDSFEFHEEPRALLGHLREQGFYPDFVRCKGYVGATTTEAVAIVPLLSFDLSRVAGIGIRRSLVDPDEKEASGTATIVRLAHGINPIEFWLVTADGGKVREVGPTPFRRLIEEGAREVASSLVPARDRRKLKSLNLGQMTKGRAIAAAAVEDLATEERDIGFISESEYHQLVKDAELYADIARLHSYLSAVALASEDGEKVGCKYCTSTSCYVCTSCSCIITAGGSKAA
jgi:hypothetical protein